MQRALPAVAVAALLAVAGCSAVADAGLGGGAGGQPHEVPLNESRVLADHAETLRAAETFTLETTGSGVEPGTEPYRGRRTVRANLATDAVGFDRRLGDDYARRAYVYGNGTGYLYDVRDGDQSYGTASGDGWGASNWVREPVADALALFDYEYAGTETADGETVHVYEATGLDRSHYRFDRLDDGDVISASATLRVRPDGLVVGVDYEYELNTSVERETASYTARYSDLGDTTLTAPVWLDEARNATGNRAE